MRILISSALALTFLAASVATASDPSAHGNYTREWIGKNYGSDGLPRVSAAFDSLPGSHAVYGQVRISGGYQNLDDGTTTGSLRQDNEASILGVRGWIGNDKMKALYNAQFFMNYDQSPIFARRLGWIGLKHEDYGQLLVGTTSTPYKIPGTRIDPFFDTPAGLGHDAQHFGEVHRLVAS